MIRGLGWNRSRHQLRYSFTGHPALDGVVTGPIPNSVDSGPSAPPIFDQGSSSSPPQPLDGLGSCWGHAAARGIATSLTLAGTPLPFVPSPDQIYRIARCLMRAGGEFSGKLTDTGTDPFYGMMGLSQWGVKAMGPTIDRYSDSYLKDVENEPTMAELEADAVNLIIGAYQITSTGDQRVEDICRAKAANFSVIVGVFVDTAFEQWTPAQGPIGAPVNPTDPNGGGHALEIDGYDTMQNGSRILIPANSWDDWGDHGRFTAKPAWITNDQAGDIYALSIRTQEAA